MIGTSRIFANYFLKGYLCTSCILHRRLVCNTYKELSPAIILTDPPPSFPINSAVAKRPFSQLWAAAHPPAWKSPGRSFTTMAHPAVV